jgi:hypothetical protein
MIPAEGNIWHESGISGRKDHRYKLHVVNSTDKIDLFLAIEQHEYRLLKTQQVIGETLFATFFQADVNYFSDENSRRQMWIKSI